MFDYAVSSAYDELEPKSRISFDQIADEVKRAQEFEKVLKQVDAMIGTPAERAKRRAEEQKAAEAKAKREKRINELYALIAKLRTMLMDRGGRDASIEAQISAAQTELFWLQFSF